MNNVFSQRNVAVVMACILSIFLILHYGLIE